VLKKSGLYAGLWGLTLVGAYVGGKRVPLRAETSGGGAEARAVENRVVSISERGDRGEGTLSERGAKKELSFTEKLTLINETTDANERMGLILRALENVEEEGYAELFALVNTGAEFERELVLKAWFQHDQVGALDVIREHFVGHLELAIGVALTANSEMAVAWAEDATDEAFGDDSEGG